MNSLQNNQHITQRLMLLFFMFAFMAVSAAFGADPFVTAKDTIEQVAEGQVVPVIIMFLLISGGVAVIMLGNFKILIFYVIGVVIIASAFDLGSVFMDLDYFTP